MKFFVDLSKKQLIKSAASNVALERLVLKRRDSLAVEVVFVSRNAVATMPAGTTVSVALKRTFADSNFLASASGTPPILNLNTVPLEALFSATNPSAITALLEIRWQIPGETTRTATLTAEVQNSVILGTEGTPQAMPDGKASQSEAEAGEDNDKWMTPLRVAQAISHLAEFADTTDELSEGTNNLYFTEARAKAALADELSEIGSEISGLNDAIDAEEAARIAGDTALGQRIDSALANLDPAAIDSIAEAVTTINTERTERIAGDTALDTKITAETTARTTAVSGLQTALDSKATTTALSTETTARISGDQSLAGGLNDLTAALTTETQARISGDQSLAGGLNDVITALAGKQPTGSYATLVNGLVPSTQLPSYVDDVLEFANLAALPAVGEQGKIYVTTTAPSKAYRWSGTAYFEISASEVTSVAGKTGAVTLALEDLTNFGSLSARAYKPTSFSYEITANSADSIVAATQLRSQHSTLTFRAARTIDFFLPTAISAGSFSWSPQLGDIFFAEILETGSFNGQWTVRFKSGSTTIHTVARSDSALKKSSLRFVYNGTSWVLDRTVYHQHTYSDLLDTPEDVATGFFDRSGDAISRPPEQGQAPHQVVLANDTRLTDARRTAWVTPPSSPTNIASGLLPGAMAYDGSFFYTLVRMPGGQTMRWARTPMTTSW